MSRGAFIFAIILVAILVSIVGFKSNGAVEHPLLVTSAERNPDPAMPAWRLMTLCPVGRRNVPTIPLESEA